MNERVIIGGLLAALVAALVGAFFWGYEKEIYTHEIPASGDAARNPLLAAERLLNKRGFDAITLPEFAPSIRLPGPTDTAIATFHYPFMSDEEMALLLKWVENGGHLIVQIQTQFDGQFDQIFTPIGVRAYEREPTAGAGDAADQTPLDGGAAANRVGLGDLRYDNGVSIDLGDTEPQWSLHDQFGVFAAQFRYAGGRLTAVSDLGIIHNASIGEFDHAFVLTQLVGSPQESSRIWLLHTSDFPSLWSLMATRAGYLFVAGLVFLMMMLWWASQRFGPPIATPRDERKAFIEHVEASGRFLWRHQGHSELLQSTQNAFLHAANRRHPTLRRLESAQRDAYLARVCGVSEKAASAAMSENQSRAHGDFLRSIQTLKTMWTRL